MQKEKKFVDRGKFERNILVVGKTDCGKTSFIQKMIR